ncbi:N-acetylmuramoyl-L-alanine amidase, partial [Bacillus cereus]
VDASIVGKRVVSTVDNLWFYNKPSWKNGDVAGTVDVGLGFITDTKIMMDVSLQYQVHNSRWKIFYIPVALP